MLLLRCNISCRFEFIATEEESIASTSFFDAAIKIKLNIYNNPFLLRSMARMYKKAKLKIDFLPEINNDYPGGPLNDSTNRRSAIKTPIKLK